LGKLSRYSGFASYRSDSRLTNRLCSACSVSQATYRIIRSIADCPNLAFGHCFARTAFLSSSVSPAAASWFCGFLHLPVDPAILGGFCNSPVPFSC
jgi:hypothetical protein